MNQKELNELRRRWKPDKNAISRIYGCFVNSNKEIITDLDESLGMMTQEEAEKYLSLLKKALSGALGKNLIDIVFSTQQVMTGEEHRMLMELRTSGAKDARVRQAFYQKVIQSLDMGESNYLLLLASDSYDVPRRNRDALRAEAIDGRKERVVARVGLQLPRAGGQVERHQQVAAAIELAQGRVGFQVEACEQVPGTIEHRQPAQAVDVERRDFVVAAIELLQVGAFAQVEPREIIAAAIELAQAGKLADLPHRGDVAAGAIHHQDALRLVARNASVVIQIEHSDAKSITSF